MIEVLNNPATILVAIPTFLISFNHFLKAMGMNDRYCPLVDLVGGLIAYPYLQALGLSWFTSILGSFMIGLSAGGFYDLNNKTIKGK